MRSKTGVSGCRVLQRKIPPMTIIRSGPVNERLIRFLLRCLTVAALPGHRAGPARSNRIHPWRDRAEHRCSANTRRSEADKNRAAAERPEEEAAVPAPYR